MNAIRKLIAITLALILTLASTALVFAPVASAHPAPVVSMSHSAHAARVQLAGRRA